MDMTEQSPDAVGKIEWPAIVLRHYQFLLDHLDPDFGILSKLVTKRILSYEQRDLVKAETTVNKRSGKLLDIIRNEDKWEELIDALKSSNQTHIVNYLVADGKYSKSVDWPLREREKNLINDNLEHLIELIETIELVTKLHSMNVISKSQRDFINSKQTSSDRNEAFLDILRRRSISDYKKTIDCLKKTNQLHIAQLLEEGGAIVALHVNTDAATDEEEDIADEITDKLVHRSVEERDRILELVQFKLIAAKPRHSIVLYAYLLAIEQLNQLKLALQSGLIKERIQQLFNILTSVSKQVSVSNVRAATEDELIRADDALLACDLYERITIKRSYSTDEGNEETDASSTLVTRPIRLSSSPNRRGLESPLGDTTSQAICDEMDDYIKVETLARHKIFLEDNIDPDSGLLDILFSKRTLTLGEINFIRGQESFKERNASLLKHITDQEKCDSFVHSLWKTGQMHLVNYLNDDGSDSIESKTTKRPYTADEQDVKYDAISLTLGKFITQLKSSSSTKIDTKSSRVSRSKSTPMRSPQTKRRKTESPSLDTSSNSAAVREKIDDLIKVETLVRHKEFLEEIVDSDSGLLDKLLFKGTLTSGEKTFIEGRHTYKTRNARLLKCITDQDKCDSFVDSIRETRQTHVVNYLIGDGSFEDRFDVDWPLTDTQINNINDSEESVVNSIDMNSLLEILYQEDVINESQRRLIDSKRNSVEKNKAFFDIFRRMSQKYYRETMQCLCKADQPLIAQILDEGGVVLRIIVKTDETPGDEDYIVAELMNMIKESGRIRKLAPLKVISAKTGHGVVLYAHCRVRKDLEYAQESLKSSELKNRVHDLFNSLYDSGVIKVLGVTTENEDEVIRFFQLKEILRNQNKAEKVESRVILQSLNDLPLEVVDNILQLCYLLLVQQSVSKNLRKNFPEQLILVNYLWLQRMTRRTFKKNISRRLAALFQRTSKRYTVVQNNRQFLMEFIRPSNELIAKLESTQYLTKEQVDIIQKLMRDRDKTFELLDLLKPFDSPKIETLIKCLRQTNQNRVAFVVESGGTVVKSTAQNFDEVKQMIKSFNDLLSQRDQSAKLVKIIDNNISRRKNRRKKMTAFWIWFRDESTFEAMRKELEAKSNHCHGNQVHEKNVLPSSVNVDLKQFRMKFVSFSIFAKFTARLVAAGDVQGVTKLKDKIYVVCRTGDPSIPCIICVFEDRNPFRLQKKLEIKEIKKPAEIASREKDNCLYVTDHAEDCIWRIKEIENENKEQENKPVKWFQFELPRRLLCSYTMTSDDELLIIEGEREKEVLNIYGSDAKISRTVDLPEEISKHFVLPVLKTSTGQLIIHHSVEESKKSLLLQQRLSRDEKFVLSEELVEECEKVEKKEEKINLRIEQEKETEEEDAVVGKEKRELEKGKGVKDLIEQKEEEAFGDEKEGDELEKGEVEEDLGVTVEEEKEFGEGEEDKEEESENQDESKEPDEKREETDHEESEIEEEEKEEADQDQSEESDNEGEKTDREESEVEEEEEESGEKKKSKEDDVLSVISEVNISSEKAYYVAHYIAPNTQFLPRSFAIDSDDRLFVADSPNDRVILFDSDLKWDAILIPIAEEKNEQFERHLFLCTLFHDENNKQLFVLRSAGKGETVIDVYTLTMR